MNMPVPVFSTVDEVQGFCLSQQKAGKTLGLVPTMGALHKGHLSLVTLCQQHCDVTLASVYVNPSQFGPNEDFDNYPRNFEQDVALLESVGVHGIFAPTNEVMYPHGFSCKVQPPKIAGSLEGELRPNHFQGVTTVVAKLLNATRADVAVFGQKDYQQLVVIRQMVADLNMATRVIAAPTARQSDGLALSSRNRYLDADQRERALSLSRALKQTKSAVEAGNIDARELAVELMQNLIDGGVDSADYAVIADAATLEILEVVDRPAVALVAAFVGSTRLIDNLLLSE